MIKLDIEMPKCCIDCPIWADENGSCSITNNRYWSDNGTNLFDPFTQRDQECPIIEES